MTTTILSRHDFKDIRVRLGLDHTQFAELFNTSPVTIYRWESGESKPIGASMTILEAMHRKTTQTSEAELKTLMAGFVVALGLVALLILLFGTLGPAATSTAMSGLSAK